MATTIDVSKILPILATLGPNALTLSTTDGVTWSASAFVYSAQGPDPDTAMNALIAVISEQTAFDAKSSAATATAVASAVAASAIPIQPGQPDQPAQPVGNLTAQGAT